jgi:hypothetical protein
MRPLFASGCGQARSDVGIHRRSQLRLIEAGMAKYHNSLYGQKFNVLITAFRRYGIATDLDVAPSSAVTAVPTPLDLAVASSSSWFVPYSVLWTRRLFRGPCAILAGVVDAGGST